MINKTQALVHDLRNAVNQKNSLLVQQLLDESTSSARDKADLNELVDWCIFHLTSGCTSKNDLDQLGLILLTLLEHGGRHLPAFNRYHLMRNVVNVLSWSEQNPQLSSQLTAMMVRLELTENVET